MNVSSDRFQIRLRPTLTPPALWSGSAESLWHCACCGLPTTGTAFAWAEQAPNTGTAAQICPVCALLQDTHRPGIAAEACLVWWPEISQSRLMFLARAAHQSLWALCRTQRDPVATWTSCLEAVEDDAATRRLLPAFRPPLLTLRLLYSRRDEAAHRLQSSSIEHVTTALRLCDTTSPQVMANISLLHQGLRLLPLGRLFENGREFYPHFLAAVVRSSTSPSAGASS